jgi:hypothetical protein
MSIVIRENRVVSLPVLANAIVRGEYRNEVRVQLGNRSGGEPAQACQAPFPFHVHQSVGSFVVRWREYLKEMIGNRLVAGLVFDETARALAGCHFVAFPWLSSIRG